MIDDQRSLFLQIADRIAADIIEGVLEEETQIPSTNQFAAFYKINPATVLKGVNLLVDEGILYKKRGIGMFVASGARSQLIEKRKADFYENFMKQMLVEARKLDISVEQLYEMIRKGDEDIG